MNDTTIEVQHNPPVGFKYTPAASDAQQTTPTQSTVHEVTDTSILVTTPSASPLAGQDLTFDVFVQSVKT